jgi:hypothetical protein
MSAGVPWPPCQMPLKSSGGLDPALIRSIGYFLLDYDCGRESYKWCFVW